MWLTSLFGAAAGFGIQLTANVAAKKHILAEPWKHALWIAGGIYVASNKDKWTEQMRARVNVIREEKGYPKYVIAEKPPKDA